MKFHPNPRIGRARRAAPRRWEAQYDIHTYNSVGVKERGAMTIIAGSQLIQNGYICVREFSSDFR